MQKTIDNHSELGTNSHIGRIIFLLPCLDIDPKTKKCTAVGGFKVVYEYANRFAADGFEVHLVYPHNSCRYKSVFHCIRSFVGFCFRRIFRQHRAGEWFKIDKNIKKQFVFNLSTPWLRLKADDCVFATALETAEKLDNIKNITLDNKYYLIQGYELWAGDKEKLHNSYRMGMHNIVIAPWLKEKVEKVGATATLITNGFNFKEFTLNNPIEKRNRYEIVMLNHELEHKRCVDAWAALDIVKQKHPQLHVSMFGVFNPPVNMQPWYTYHRNPTHKELNDIYNNGAIYVAASDFEGFGLTIGEAMICGCAVACTDNGGFKCMAEDGKTALLSPIYDIEALANNISKLIEDNCLRKRIAYDGNNYIQNFSWENSYTQMKNLITKQ